MPNLPLRLGLLLAALDRVHPVEQYLGEAVDLAGQKVVGAGVLVLGRGVLLLLRLVVLLVQLVVLAAGLGRDGLVILDARALLLAQQDAPDPGERVAVALDLDGAVGPAAAQAGAPLASGHGPGPVLAEPVVARQLGLALQLALLAARVYVLVEREHPLANVPRGIG